PLLWEAPWPEEVACSSGSVAHAATSNKAAAMLKIFMRIISPLCVENLEIQDESPCDVQIICM
ncbi:MAG: hypothetical protein VW709_01015, partial [Rickettsiales bacterium]